MPKNTRYAKSSSQFICCPLNNTSILYNKHQIAAIFQRVCKISVILILDINVWAPLNLYEFSRILIIKAIGGSGSKKIILGLYERPLCLGNDAFYRMSKSIGVQKLYAVEVLDFSSNAHRFRTKIVIF